jgi:hypothetical protein
MRVLRTFVFALLLCGVSFAGDGKFVRVSPDVIKTQLKNMPSDPAERVRMVRSNFMTAGCGADQITEQAVPNEALPNILCTLPGKEEGTIVVAARLDYKSKGDELAVDNATLNLLPLLAQTLRPIQQRYTLVFIALSGHDRFKGSTYYLSQLTGAQKKSIRGMIFLDHLGRTSMRYLFPSQANDTDLANIALSQRGLDAGASMAVGNELVAKRSTHSDSALRKQLSQAAKAGKMEEPGVYSDFYFTDALNFEYQHIMALTLTSPAYIIVSRDSGMREVQMIRTAVDPRAYYVTYNLLCTYLLSLDNALGATK